MSHYQCVRCKHKTKQKVEMSRHLSRKNKCSRCVESYALSDEEIINISLTPLFEKDIISKKFECLFCNKLFTRIFTLERHKKYAK